MSNVAKYSKKNHEMVTYAVGVIVHLKLTGNKTRLGIDQAKLDTASTNVGLLKDNWDKHEDPNLHTTIVNDTNTRLIILVKENFNSLFADIKDDVLNETDRQTLHIYERAKGNPIPVVDYSPVFMIKSVAFLLLKLVFLNSATPNSKAMPKGHKIFFEYYIGEAGLKAGNIPFANAVNISIAFHTLQFDETDLGKTVYMHCYYENAHGQRSPVSTTLSKLIS